MPDETNAAQMLLADAAEFVPPPDYAWTESIATSALLNPDVASLVQRVENDLDGRHILLPDQKRLVERCVSALLVGHLILQGPPGTGKTSLAKALAQAFDAGLETTTATSEWSPFHVVGGLRPNATGGLEPVLGAVSRAVLACAETVRASQDDSSSHATPGPTSTWLLIDEFNRADIDKAIGSLYTLLSSADPTHVATTPIELWFAEEPQCQHLWVPARFRIIGTMNDLDTNYVSPMSQGLRRRFQFVTVGVPQEGATAEHPVSGEVLYALQGAQSWLSATYPNRSVPPADALQDSLERLQRVLDGLRRPGGAITGWPVGTAQAVDVLRNLLLSGSPGDSAALDIAVADRLVGQMNTVNKAQFEGFATLFEREGLSTAARELRHLYRPYTTT